MKNTKLYKPLSNFDLLKGITKEMKERGNIYDMGEIDDAQNLEDIFKGRGHTILFEPPEEGSDVGHWTALLRNEKGIIYFDSYGSELKDAKLRKLIGQVYPVLQFNPVQFQDYGKSAVCGRYALMCVGLNKLFKNLSVIDIVKFLKKKPKKMSFDKYVLSLTREV